MAKNAWTDCGDWRICILYSCTYKSRNRYYDSFYGWYYPDETGIHDYYEQEFIDYVNSKTAFSKQLNPNLKTLIAPYGTNHVKTDEKFVEQLKYLDVDFVAYQDEVGVKKSTVDETSSYYKQLKKAHDLAKKSKLWADVEIFDFEGDVYKSALLPIKVKSTDSGKPSTT